MLCDLYLVKVHSIRRAFEWLRRMSSSGQLLPDHMNVIANTSRGAFAARCPALGSLERELI